MDLWVETQVHQETAVTAASGQPWKLTQQHLPYMSEKINLIMV